MPVIHDGDDCDDLIITQKQLALDMVGDGKDKQYGVDGIDTDQEQMLPQFQVEVRIVIITIPRYNHGRLIFGMMG